jgi:hypothetical protein
MIGSGRGGASWGTLALALGLIGCSPATFHVNDRSSVKTYVTQPSAGPANAANPAGLRFKPGLCSAEELRPDGRVLTEGNLIEFLNRQQLDVRIERPRADLIYLVVSGAGTDAPVRLRVAILNGPSQAGLDLHQALLEHGPGSWGVHRSNLAVLGPIGSLDDDLVFAAKTRLSCWGMFMTAGRDDIYAVPGGYREL